MVVVVRTSGFMWALVTHTERRTSLLQSHVMSLGLTFASFRAVRPLVINVFVRSTPAVLVPSTTRGTTTDSAGFPKRSTLRTHCRAKDH